MEDLKMLTKSIDISEFISFISEETPYVSIQCHACHQTVFTFRKKDLEDDSWRKCPKCHCEYKIKDNKLIYRAKNLNKLILLLWDEWENE